MEKRNFKHTFTMLSEFFKSYMIVAYDYNGEQIMLQKYASQEEFNALLVALDNLQTNITEQIENDNEEEFSEDEGETFDTEDLGDNK